MVLPNRRPCQPSLHHHYRMMCTHWQMWVVWSPLDEGGRLLEQTHWPLFFRSVSSLALHLERSPPSALRVPPAHNPCKMVFFPHGRSKTFNFPKASGQNDIYFQNCPPGETIRIGRKIPHASGLEWTKFSAKSCFITGKKSLYVFILPYHIAMDVVAITLDTMFLIDDILVFLGVLCFQITHNQILRKKDNFYTWNFRSLRGDINWKIASSTHKILKYLPVQYKWKCILLLVLRQTYRWQCCSLVCHHNFQN